MSRDVKTGMLIGLVLVIIGLIVISIWPGGGVEDRLMKHTDERTVQPVLGGVGADSNDPDESTTEVADEDNDSSVLQADPVGEPNEDIHRVAEQVVEEFNDPPIDTTPRVHIVAENESLSSIAKLHYGDANKWPVIAEANKDVITNVNRLSLGMHLVIPKP